MKNIELLIIKPLILLLVFVLIGCSGSDTPNTNETKKLQKNKQKTEKQKSVKKKQFAKKKFVRLSNDNLVKELTAYGNANKESLILMKTPKGNMKIKLYENTPLHRANIIRLIKNNFYKGTMFYRVVDDFMIQGGDSDDWERKSIKDKMGRYTIPAEFRAGNIHKKGALAMAREYKNNPEKRSVPFEFFIVQGTKYNDAQLRGAEIEYGLKISPEHQELYKNPGGCPHLDGQHTVFGQVVEGLEVIDAIAAVKTDEGDWPIENITIGFEIIE